jgi:uncharacterized repeat protein (TIGR04052 family)
MKPSHSRPSSPTSFARFGTTVIIFATLGACAPAPVPSDAGDSATAQDVGDSTVASDAADASTPTDAPTSGSAFTIRFAGMVGSQMFSCSQPYPMMGMGSASTWTPKDFRFYVHDVRLVTADGEVPLTIDTMGAFQGQNVALLDFENDTGACAAEGSPETNSEIRARAATTITAAIRGIKFKLGVPFMLNHREPSSSPAPLNLSAMWWAWNSGYKFLKIDGNTAGLPMGFNIHLGSTGCMGNNAGPVNPCSAPNVGEVSLDNFNPTTNRIVADLAALVSMSNLEMNAAGAPGCMSGATDPECPPIFSALGIPFGSATAGTQRFFRVE